MLANELREICDRHGLDDSIYNELLELIKTTWTRGLHSCPCGYKKKRLHLMAKAYMIPQPFMAR